MALCSRERAAQLPTEHTLSHNYPNPFNPEIIVEYQLPRPGLVKVAVYNLAGQLIRNLVNTHQSAGHFKLRWDGKDDRGNNLASGVYLYRLEASGFSAMKKMILMR